MRTLLLIDDDELALAAFGDMLTFSGYEILSATGGELGLQLARQHHPDLILCDINMPVCDGWSVLRSLREDPDIATIPFVLMTGNSHDNQPRHGMNLGADDFLTKPFDRVALLHCVESRLKRADQIRQSLDSHVSKLRSQLQAYLPHELFTPLAGMIGLIDILRDPECPSTPEDNHDLLNDLHLSAWRLHRTLRNYLLALELQTTTLPPAPVTLPRLAAHEVVERGAQVAAERHHRQAHLSLDLAPVEALGHASDLALAVEEIVDNACAYSPAGSPLFVRLTPAGLLTIMNQGPGLTSDQIRHLEAFQQFDRKTREQQGLGLGFFLARHLAARNLATFSLVSTPGHTTTVSLQLTFPTPQG